MLRSPVSLLVGVVVIVFCVVPQHPTTQSAVRYGLVDLGTVEQSASYAEDIDWRGRVVGVTTGTRDRAFLYDGTRSILLDTVGGTLGGSLSGALGIDNGVIAGWSNPVGSTASRAYVYDGTTSRAIGTLGGAHSAAHDINGGWIAGASSLPSGAEHAFLYDGATMRDLGTLGGASSYAYGVNGSGWVTGTALTPAGAQHAFLYDGVAMRDLGTLGGTHSIGRDINRDGWIVGRANLAGGAWRAFVRDGTAMRSLGTLGGTYSEAFGIHDAAFGPTSAVEIVGDASTSTGAMHAFVYANGQMTDLNTVIDPALGWVLTGARAINDAGQIAGFGVVGGQTRAFRLTPAQDFAIWANSSITLEDSNFPNPSETGRGPGFIMTVGVNEDARPSPLQTLTVTDTFFGAVDSIGGQVIDGPACTVTGNTVTCAVPGVGYGRQQEVRTWARSTAPGEFGHTARVSGESPDPDVTNNTLSEDNLAVSLSNLTATPSTLAGGKPSSLRVYLTSGAPKGGAAIKLVSSNPAVISVPATFLMPFQGETTRAMNIYPKVVAASTAVTITATYGLQSRSVTLTVLPPALSTLSLTPTTLIGGCRTASGKVTLTGTAPSIGAVVTLANTNTAATVPTSLTIAAGGTSKTFTVTSQALTIGRSGTVTAQYGGVSKALALYVRPIRVRTLALTPNPVVGGSTVVGTVTLECGAAPGNLVVALSSSNTALAVPVLTSITIPAGTTTGSFSVRTADVSVAASAYIYATVSGTRKSALLSINP